MVIELPTVELPLYIVLIAAALVVLCLIFFVDVLQTEDEKFEKVENKLKEISDRNTEIMDAFEKHLKENESYTNYQDLSQNKLNEALANALEEQNKVNESYAKALEEQGKVNETLAEAIKHLDETKSNKRKSKKKTEEE